MIFAYRAVVGSRLTADERALIGVVATIVDLVASEREDDASVVGAFEVASGVAFRTLAWRFVIATRAVPVSI